LQDGGGGGGYLHHSGPAVLGVEAAALGTKPVVANRPKREMKSKEINTVKLLDFVPFIVGLLRDSLFSFCRFCN